MDRYTPTLESLDSHPLPEWYDDAKLGMFIDWGLYSIAGWAPQVGDGARYPDWYLWKMYHRSRTKIYHKKTWGKEFEADDFIPLFTASDYVPKAIINLAKESGMRYIVPFTKMHDGYCLWPSSYSLINVKDLKLIFSLKPKSFPKKKIFKSYHVQRSKKNHDFIILFK